MNPDMKAGGPASVRGEADVAVVIVSYNTSHLLDRLFASIEAGRGNLRVQVIVVDNASRDDSATHLRQIYPQAELIVNEVNVGFGRANNQALARVRAPYVLLLNTDAFMSPGALAETVQFMNENPDCGVLGVRLTNEDGSLQPCCRYFPTPWNVFLSAGGLARLFPGARLVDDMDWSHNAIRNCDWVPGCYYLVRRKVIDQVGLFDPRYFVYYEEVDHCRAVRKAGWEVIYYPYACAVHLGGESAKSDEALSFNSRQISRLQIESELLYFRKQFGLAGLLGHLLLTISRDAMIAAKAAVRRNRSSRLSEALKHLGTTVAVLRESKFATRPTR